jgi:DNA polymerase-3 subunit delta'
MSARKTEPEIAVRHPRETPDLFGHREAETALLTAYRSGRIPHAWLIGGPQGIGKATLAYRMARFVLAHRDPLAPSVQRAETLAVDPAHHVARQITAGAHGGLLTLERTLNEKGVMRTFIIVDQTRETVSFFGSTAAVDGWRVCIVDTVDELNPNAANALLKILEEPPQRSLFLLVSHSPARALPTILSRCRKLPLRPLATDDVIRAAAKAANIAIDDPALAEAAEAAEGSVVHALTLVGGDALKLHQKTAALLAALPELAGLLVVVGFAHQYPRGLLLPADAGHLRHVVRGPDRGLHHVRQLRQRRLRQCQLQQCRRQGALAMTREDNGSVELCTRQLLHEVAIDGRRVCCGRLHPRCLIGNHAIHLGNVPRNGGSRWRCQ